MTESMRWEGPGHAVVNDSLVIPSHASLRFRDDQWGGMLHIDTFAPIEDVHELVIELELREVGRRRVEVQEIANVTGIASENATVGRFRGLEPLERPAELLPSVDGV